jgi:hypothetical protein
MKFELSTWRAFGRLLGHGAFTLGLVPVQEETLQSLLPISLLLTMSHGLLHYSNGISEGEYFIQKRGLFKSQLRSPKTR